MTDAKVFLKNIFHLGNLKIAHKKSHIFSGLCWPFLSIYYHDSLSTDPQAHESSSQLRHMMSPSKRGGGLQSCNRKLQASLPVDFKTVW